MLVKITGKQNEEILTVSSLDVAEDFEKEHKHILESIRNLAAENSATKLMFVETEFENRGKKYPMFIMNRDGFSLLVMGFTGNKALEWKIKYIQAFNEMEKELKRLHKERQQWEIERAKGVVIRHILTDTIKMKISDSPNKKFAYPNYTKLIYKTLFNKNMKELQEKYEVKNKESIRDYITTEQLKEVESMEMLVSSLINCGWGYEQIKDFIQQNKIKQLAG